MGKKRSHKKIIEGDKVYAREGKSIRHATIIGSKNKNNPFAKFICNSTNKKYGIIEINKSNICLVSPKDKDIKSLVTYFFSYNT